MDREMETISRSIYSAIDGILREDRPSYDRKKNMLKERFTRPFRRLRGKLTLSYTVTSAVTFLLIEVILVTIILLAIGLNIPFFILNSLKQEAPQATPYFIHGSPDREALTAWLQVINANGTNQGPVSGHMIFLAVGDPQGQTIASIGSDPIPVQTAIQAQLSPQEQANLRAVLHDGKGSTSTINQEADGTMVAITPIVRTGGGNVLGVLVMKTIQPDIVQIVSGFFRFILASAIVVTTIAAITGMVSGYLTARGLTRRLKVLSAAADKWSRGNFSLLHDPSEDELGQTTRQLNRMAEQLQQLLQTRQKLATLEERNRLARELHDSVKQQIFAVGMQLGATKVLLKRDTEAAEGRLQEAEKLVRQAQQELTSLIRELRPVALEGKGLVVALRELVTQWTQQTNIVATLHSEEIQTISLAVEEALFRIGQEALANVARHSGANLVQMRLTTTDEMVMLSVVDNGQGFDTKQGQLGLGLRSIQERMKIFGGDAKVESTPGNGTCIVASCKRLGMEINNIDREANSE